MKKLPITGALTLLLSLFIAEGMYAQGDIEITPIFGYTFNGRVESYTSTFKISDDISYGAIVSYNLDDYSAVELSFRHSDNSVTEYFYPTGQTYNIDIGIDHYQLGFQRILKKGQVEPFAGMALGTSRYYNKDNRNDVWAFSGSLGGGVKLFFSDHIGLRFHSNLIMPMVFGGAGFFCGVGTTGGGCGAGASFYVPTVHWENSLGIIFKI